MKNITYINAGAGSGKTYTLTKTLTNLIKDKGIKPEEVILTTFTIKAADEFKEKAKAFLFEEGLFDEALRLDQAMIGTIHSVCQRMIGKYWFNLGLAPDMGVLSDDDSNYYISQSLSDLPTEDELKLLHRFCEEFDIPKNDGFICAGVDYDFWKEDLKSIIKFTSSYELEDYRLSEKRSLEYIAQFKVSGNEISYTEEELRAILDEHTQFLANKGTSKEAEKRKKRLEELYRRLPDPTIGWHYKLYKLIKELTKCGPLADEFVQRISTIWSTAKVYDKQEEYIKLMFRLAARWKDSYTQFKQEKNLLDFEDMEKYMRQLMKDKSIAAEIAQSYRYLFVDEFQDSSPIQVKIFDALSELMEHSYWVGDYKQAIYGFRGADTDLTKAVVDAVVSGNNIGCDTYTLDTSYRSLPDIVKLNNAVFSETFSSVLKKENIVLKAHRENKTSEDCLRYFRIENDITVDHQVAKLLCEGVSPNDIAILARDNKTLDGISKRLNKDFSIPTAREAISIVESRCFVLIESLLRIINSSKDLLAKATVAFLVESDFTIKKIIEQKLLHDENNETKPEEFLNAIPIIKSLLDLKPVLQQQSIKAMVETMIIEMNLFNIVKVMDPDSAFAMTSLNVIITSAMAYEDYCVQMNLPTTIEGFIAYLKQAKPTAGGNVNGVQLHTYHSCKGLQWKYVILMSLNNNIANQKKAVKKLMYGVNYEHIEAPSAVNPYPEVYIRLIPWIFGTDTTAPDEIWTEIMNSDGFAKAYESMIAEYNRLLYVGMTRACDVLIFNLEKSKAPLQWFIDEGLRSVAQEFPIGNADLLGVGIEFTDCTLSLEDVGSLEPYGGVDEMLGMRLRLGASSIEELAPKYLSPSMVKGKGEIGSYHDFQHRIAFAKQPSEMQIVGDCIHHCFANIKEDIIADDVEMDGLLLSYDLAEVLNAKDIQDSWYRLINYISEVHGTAVQQYHEKPFRLEQDGQVFTGSIDFIWQTEEGSALIDFKTCPMGNQAILDSSDSTHFAGLYAGQLNTYAKALRANGENVLKKYLYYPVSGFLVEII